MSRVRAHLTPSRLGAAVLAVIALLDLASGLGLLRPPRPAPAPSAPVHREVPLAPRGTRAVRVVAPRVRVRPGDQVDVLVTLDPERYPAAEPTRRVGEGITVVSVDRAGADPDARGVTLAVPRALVPRMAFASTAGTLTLAVVPAHRGV